jgi:hypothetical protein
LDHQDGHTDGGEHHLAPPSSITSSLIRLAASTAKAAGYKRTAELITEWPELAGSKLGVLIMRLRNKTDEGGTITAADQSEVETALAEQPQAAAQLLGIVVDAASSATLSAEAEMNQILGFYSTVLDTITASMHSANTSFALGGFLHDRDCISYWHRTGPHPKLVLGRGYLYPLSLDVYFLSERPTFTNLKLLNEEIRRNPNRQLPRQAYDLKQNRSVSKLQRIEELQVIVEQLPPIQGPPPSPFFKNESPLPEDVSYDIPFGAPQMARLFESLLEAQHHQGAALAALNATVSHIEERKKQ